VGLSTSLLVSCHKDMKTKVDKALKDHTVCLISDGWSNIKNDSVINYMGVSPSCSLFLESTQTGEQGHTAQFLADDIVRVITARPGTIFAGAVTDNTSANKAAWKLLRDRFPTCFFQGCCAHGLHLLVKDIFGAVKTKKAGDNVATFPVGYPFEYLQDFVSTVKELVNFMRNHHAIKSKLNTLQQVNGGIALARACPTRWGSIKAMCESVLVNEPNLHAVVSEREFLLVSSRVQRADRENIKAFVTGCTFVSNLEKVIMILKPVDALVVKYQSDKVPISEVWPDFLDLPGAFDKLAEEAGGISHIECNYIHEKIRERAVFLLGDGHGLAYQLDPRYIGEGLEDDEVEEIQSTLKGDSGH
jgi:Protein of unknown function (DUF 659)